MRETVTDIDLDRLESVLGRGNVPEESLAELKSYGMFLASQLESRRQHHQNRALSLMGWALAALSFMVAGHDDLGAAGALPLAVAASLMCVAMLLAFVAGWREKADRPGMEAWFWAEESPRLDNLVQQPWRRLSSRHILALAQFYSWRSKVVATKSHWLLGAEIVIILAGLSLLAVVLGL